MSVFQLSLLRSGFKFANLVSLKNQCLICEKKDWNLFKIKNYKWNILSEYQTDVNGFLFYENKKKDWHVVYRFTYFIYSVKWHGIYVPTSIGLHILGFCCEMKLAKKKDSEKKMLQCAQIYLKIRNYILF